MIVKVCGMREKGNILELLELSKPDYMGLIFYPPSSRYVPSAGLDPIFYKELDVAKVGVFVNEGLDKLIDTVNVYGLDAVQLHGDEDTVYLEALRRHIGSKIFKVFRIGEGWTWDRMTPFIGKADLMIFDTETKLYGGSGHTFDWSLLSHYSFEQPFLLGGGISKEHALQIKQLALDVPAMVGVDINSKFELVPGLKDIRKISTFIQSLR